MIPDQGAPRREGTQGARQPSGSFTAARDVLDYYFSGLGAKK